jgi:hypothetical protein
VAAAAAGLLGADTFSTMLLLAAAGGMGIVVYVGASWALRVEEIRTLRDLLHRAAAS